MKKTLIFACLMMCGITLAQTVNDYQYVLVPSKFSFVNEADKYGLNTLTKGLLSKYGFVAYFDTDAIPDELRNSNCNKLYADVVENNNITSTKVAIVLKDCKNNIIFQSQEGKSREKDWRVGYNMALRDAFQSFDALNYKYNGNNALLPQNSQASAVLKTGKQKVTGVQPDAIASRASLENGILFAQPIAGGYQLIDTAPKVVMKLYNTSNPTVFIAEKNEQKGVLQSHNEVWTFDYYLDGTRYTETLNIKF